MNIGILICYQMHFLAQQSIMNTPDCLFIARYLARRENHRITCIQADLLMHTLRDTCHGRARFPLRAGTDNHQIFTRDQTYLAFRHKIGNIL